MARSTSNLREGADGRQVHDVGGLDFGPIDRSDRELTFYEKRVDALMILMAEYQAFSIDAMRRTIEDYSQQEYDGTGYYDRWVKALCNLLIEQEVLSRDEIAAQYASVREGLIADGVPVDLETVL